jgi:hypothetical protein
MMMNYYAAGGQAQKLASYGRGGDTELVHMTKGEIKGLQDLALAYGGSLSINPNTGLVEAGFLRKMLPVIAGAALTIGSGGALSPLAASMIVGGGYGLATGSITKGLMAGLSAYGGASLGSSLGALGGETLATQGGDAALNAFKETQQQAITSGLENLPVGSGGVGVPTESGMYFPGATPGALPGSSGAGVEIGSPGQMSAAGTDFSRQAASSTINNLGLQPAVNQGYQSALNAPGVNPQDVVSAAGRAQGATGATAMGNVSRGIGEVFSSPSAAGQFAKSNIGALGSAIVPSLISDQQQSAGPAGYQEDEYDRQLKGYRMSPNYQAYEAPRPNPYYQATYAAAGGVMNSFDDENGSDSNMASGGIAQYKNKGQVNVLQEYLNRQAEEQTRQSGYLPESVAIPRTGIFRDTDVDTARKTADEAAEIRLGKAFKAAGIKPVAFPKTAIRGLGDISGITRDTTEVAKGGVMSSLGGYSDGGRMLKGPGDGMSDSIPASISGKQPARLADGEFVVPADVVSHLGNGSTDAGAKKLYGMMDRIRKARTGKKKQAPAVKTARYMPA